MRNRVLALAAATLVSVHLASPAAVAGDDVRIAYRLTNARVVVTGSVTSTRSFATGFRESEPTEANMSLVLEPDATVLKFDPASSAFSKDTIAVQVATGGALKSVNASSEGQLGVIVRNIFSAALGVGRILSGGAPFGTTSPAENRYQTEHGEQNTRRKLLRAGIDAAVDVVAASGREAATETNPAKLKALTSRIGALLEVIPTLRAELELLDARYSSWKTQFQDTQIEAVEYRLKVMDLPKDADLAKLFTGTQTPASVSNSLSGTSQAIFERLGVLITRLDDGALAGPAAASATKTDVIYHRLPRPVTFKWYELGNVGNTTELVLRNVSTENVIDEWSPLEALPLSTSKWAKKTLSATFTDAGVLTQLSNERESEIAGATETVRALPSDYLGVLKQSNEIAEQQRKLSLQTIDAQVDRLNREKSQKEAALALREIDNVGELKAQISQLESQTKFLDAQRALTASGASGDAKRSLQSDQELLKLENAIAAAKAERLELDAKLETLRRQAEK
jgi:hypothetical protein